MTECQSEEMLPHWPAAQVDMATLEVAAQRPAEADQGCHLSHCLLVPSPFASIHYCSEKVFFR